MIYFKYFKIYKTLQELTSTHHTVSKIQVRLLRPVSQAIGQTWQVKAPLKVIAGII